jgi:hypothetical protein
MSSYFQMGHDTENLVGEKDLDEFKGIILSPLNREPIKLENHISTFRRMGSYDIILDPQLYFPLCERGKLQQQPYFPPDFDTADYFSISWWEKILNPLCDFAKKLRVDTVASPVILPKVFRPDYFSICAEVSQKLFKKLSGTGISPLTTGMIDLSILTKQDLVFEAASLLSEADTMGYYIVFVSDIEPRREFSDSEALFGAMSLINVLKNTGRRVIVSHCSSDMLLYKTAGATHCATGKFFNLRRFTKSRFDEPSGGGGQLPYWFEHSLLAFIREADVKRIITAGYDKLIGTLASGNYWSEEIKKNWDENPDTAWVGYGWRQYLSWFGKTESALEENNALDVAVEWLRTAEANWLDLEDDVILMDEPRNDGKWIRPWRQTLSKFSKFLHE